MSIKNYIAVLFVGSAALAAGFAACYGQTNSADSAPPEVQAAYQQLDTAMDQRDDSAILAAFAPNMIYIDSSGKVHTRDQIAEHIRLGNAMSQSVDSVTTIESAHVQASGTTVGLVRKEMVTVVNAKTGVLNTIAMVKNVRDHWIETGGVWKINRERVLSSYTELNGQPVKGVTI
jgi:hypothetical protein